MGRPPARNLAELQEMSWAARRANRMRYTEKLPEYEDIDKVEVMEVTTNRMMFAVSHDRIKNMQTPVIVEMWEHAVGPQAYGKPRKRWLSEFTAPERKRAGALHTKFRKWYLVTGTPEYAIMSFNTIAFIRRLTDFFGTI